MAGAEPGRPGQFDVIPMMVVKLPAADDVEANVPLSSSAATSHW